MSDRCCRSGNIEEIPVHCIPRRPWQTTHKDLTASISLGTMSRDHRDDERRSLYIGTMSRDHRDDER